MSGERQRAAGGRALMSRAGVLLSVLLVAVAFVLGIVVAPGGPGGLPLSAYRDANVVTLVPDGWKDLNLVGAYGTSLVGWVDPGDATATETVQADRHAAASPQARIASLAATLHRRSGYSQAYLGTVALAGGRSLWSLWYRQNQISYAVFAFDACTPTIAMTVTLSAADSSGLDNEALAIPQGAEPVCDGAAFSKVDRADPAIPLHLP
jgi:hypothetical protein